MPKALEILSWHVVAVSTTLTSATMEGTDSKQVRSVPGKILSIWGKNQAIGDINIYSGQMHDAARSIMLKVPISEVYPLFRAIHPEPLVGGDQLNIYQSGSAVAGDFDCGSMLIGYESIANGGRFADPMTVKARGKNFTTATATLTAATTGGYGGGTALSAFTHQLKNGKDYALVGFETSIEQCSIAILGSDTALRLGGPGHELDKSVTNFFFWDLSIDAGSGWIPVINIANASGTTITCVNDENAASPVVTLNFIELPDGVVPALG